MPAVDSLLATKLYIPAPRPHRVPRPRLTARIAAGAAGPLTLISAPAGFGKSTLLSDWAHEGGRRVAWVSLDAAFENARQAVHLGRRGGIGNGLLSGYVVSMRILTARGDFAGAFEALERAEEVVRRTGQPRWLATIEAFRARLHLRRFRVEDRAESCDAAARWARESGFLAGWTDRRELPLLQDFKLEAAAITLARVLLLAGDAETALDLLAALRRRAEESGWTRPVIEALGVEALARQAQGDRDGALAAVSRALALAEPEGFVRIFVGEGAAMAELVAQAAPGAVSPDYQRRLRQAFGLPEPAAAGSAPPDGPLSEREVEVLRLIASGLSNAEAGRRLFIAPSTVKKHLENIYEKLGTRRRTAAIARARELGVL